MTIDFLLSPVFHPCSTVIPECILPFSLHPSLMRSSLIPFLITLLLTSNNLPMYKYWSAKHMKSYLFSFIHSKYPSIFTLLSISIVRTFVWMVLCHLLIPSILPTAEQVVYCTYIDPVSLRRGDGRPWAGGLRYGLQSACHNHPYDVVELSKCDDRFA